MVCLLSDKGITLMVKAKTGWLSCRRLHATYKIVLIGDDRVTSVSCAVICWSVLLVTALEEGNVPPLAHRPEFKKAPDRLFFVWSSLLGIPNDPSI